MCINYYEPAKVPSKHLFCIIFIQFIHFPSQLYRVIPGEHLVQDAAASETDEVTEGLRELLANLEPLIKSSGSSANLGGMLGYLEENDDEFKRLQFVEWVRNRLEASVRALVEEEVGLQCRQTELTPHKMKLVAPAILHKVLQSAEMKECLAGMQMRVADASWEMARYEFISPVSFELAFLHLI